ncbi:MAG: hypothetical protein WCP46_00985 [Alphaproteobacteria bacterium]
MKASKELLQHLSANVWGISTEGFRVILEAFNGNPFETIHIQLPPESELLTKVIDKLTEDNLLLKDCVNDLDARLKLLEANEAPTLKRNLSLDNTEQEYLTPQEQFRHNQWMQRN